MATETNFEVMDPTVEPMTVESNMASRLNSLEGAVLGLLANGKRNSAELLDLIREVLSDLYEFKDVVVTNKGNPSRPCPLNLMEEMSEKCDVVITSSGD